MVDLISNSTAIAEKTPKKSNLHKKRKLVIIAGVCLIIAAAAIFYFKSFTGSESTAVQQETATITKGDLTEYINATGPVEAASRKVLTSMVTTEISKINFKEGDKVKKGEVLFELDASDARTNIVNTQQSIAEAQQNLDESLKNLEEMKIKAPFSGYVSNISIKNDDSVKNGQTLMTLTDTSRLTLSLPFNLADAERLAVGQSAAVYLDGIMQTVNGSITGINKEGYTSPGGARLSLVEITVKNPGSLVEGLTATAGIDLSGTELSSSESGKLEYFRQASINSKASGTIAAISVKENQFVESGTLLAELTDSNLETTITGNRLNLEVKEAQLKILEQKLQTEYNVTAPMDGTITSLDVSEGDQINKGSQLAVLSDLSYLKYESAIDELDIENIQKGQEVGITVAAFPDTKKANLKGAVFDISKEGTVSRSFSSSITTYPVTIRIDDPGKLKLGMNVDGNILIGSASDVLMLPSDAIKTINSKSFVYLKLKAGESAADYKGLAGGGNAGGGFPGDGNSTAGNSGSQNSGSTGNKGSSGSTGRNGNSANNSSSGNSGRNGNSGQSFRMASGQAGAAGMYGQMAQNSSSGKSSSSSDYYANTVLIPVETGLTADGYTEIKSQLLKEGDTVVIPEATTSSSSVNMQNNFGGGPPPF